MTDFHRWLNDPAPYSSAWWRAQPPEPLALTVKKFLSQRDRLSPAVRRYLEKHLPDLDTAAQIDAEMRRLGVLR